MCYCVRPSGAGAINEMPPSDGVEISMSPCANARSDRCWGNDLPRPSPAELLHPDGVLQPCAESECFPAVKAGRDLEEAVIAGWQHSAGDEQAPKGDGAHRDKADADGAVLGSQYYGDAIER